MSFNDMEDAAPSVKKETENKYREWLGKFTLLSNKAAAQTEEYGPVHKRMRNAKIAYVIFVLAMPAVFRYMLYSSVVYSELQNEFIAIGNGTIAMETNWKCRDCEGITGSFCEVAL
jgi:hypothetical protein